MGDPIYAPGKADRIYRRLRVIMDRYKRRCLVLDREELAAMLGAVAENVLDFADGHDMVRAESFAPPFREALARIMADEFPTPPGPATARDGGE